jgi:hypothetical protein
MRKLTAAQVAAMAASIGVLSTTATRLALPVLGVAVSSQAYAYDDDELEEVVVTGTRPTGPAWDVYVVPSGGSCCSGSGGAVPPVAVAPSNAVTTPNRNALRCATEFSIQANVNPAGGGGQEPSYHTLYMTGYAWGTSNANLPAEPVITSTNAPPGPGYERVLGWTSPVRRISYIYTTNVQYDATQQGLNYQSHLINTLAHEWAHQWNPYSANTHTEADRLGNLAQQLYDQAGGANASCNTRPIRYRDGNLGGGGRK